MSDTVSDVGNIEQTGSAGIDEVLLLVFLGIGIVFVLAIVFDYKNLASLGVGEIGSFLGPIQAFFNGLANLITSFFEGLAKDASSLFIGPVEVQTAANPDSWPAVPLPMAVVA